MIKPYKEKLNEISSTVEGLLEDVLQVNEIIYQIIDEKDVSIAAEAEKVLKKRKSQLSDIDNLIVKVLALYAPEAVDLRTMIAYLKITNEIERSITNSRNYVKNIQRFITAGDTNIAKILTEAEKLQKTTITTLTLLLKLFKETQKEKVEKLYSDIAVESAKSDDIYGIIEKDILQMIQCDHAAIEDYFNLLKTIRKSQKIIDRTEGIASLLVFSKVGGEIS